MSEGFREPGRELEWAQKCRGKVAFLRHRIGGLEHLESSDWDIAVRDHEWVNQITGEVLGCPLLTVSRVYVEQRYFPWGQVDFLPSFEWNGLVFLEAGRFWKGVSVGGDGLPRPCLAHDAFLAWMTGLLTGASYNKRYDSLLRDAWLLEKEELRRSLEWAFGLQMAQEMAGLLDGGDPGKAKHLVPDLRRILRYRSIFRSPGATSERIIRHWGRELALHWKPPFPWVAFLGPDGVGKSTVIEGLEANLAGSRLKILLVHWRPKMAGFEPEDAVPVTDPHGRSPRGWLSSTLALGLLVIRWLIGRFGRTWHQRAKQKIMVSDRYYPDLLVDPRRYRYGGSQRLARWIFRFLPKPDLTIVLHASPEIVFSRKQEVSPRELQRQIEEYRALAGLLPNDVALVDTGGERQDVAEEVKCLVYDRLFGKAR